MPIKFGSPIIDKKEISSVIRVLKSGILVHGRNTLDFEEKFRKYTDSKYSVAVSSCTAGLHLYYFDLGIGDQGDQAYKTFGDPSHFGISLEYNF